MHGVPSAAIIGSNYVRCDMEPFSKNKLTLNNLDDRITFMYQYAWKDVLRFSGVHPCVVCYSSCK